MHCVERRSMVFRLIIIIFLTCYVIPFNQVSACPPVDDIPGAVSRETPEPENDGQTPLPSNPETLHAIARAGVGDSNPRKQSLANRAIDLLYNEIQRLRALVESLTSETSELALELGKSQTATRKMEVKTQRLFRHPKLLGFKIYNMHYFNSELPKTMFPFFRLKQPITVFLIDLEFFKKINSTFGMSYGDILIEKFAETLIAQIRINEDVDICIRWGGDEFMIVLPGTSRDDAFTVANRIYEAVENVPVDNKKATGLATPEETYPHKTLKIRIGMDTYVSTGRETLVDIKQIFKQMETRAVLAQESLKASNVALFARSTGAASEKQDTSKPKIRHIDELDPQFVRFLENQLERARQEQDSSPKPEE